MQVMGRWALLRCVLTRLGPLIFGLLVAAVSIAELALCYPLLAPFGVWPVRIQKVIARAARVYKWILWPWVFWCCPWINVEVRNKHLMKRVGEDRSRGTMLLLNHTSFVDAPLVLCYFPLRVAALHRVLAMAAVMRMPLIGHIFKSERHIPVHFSSEKKGSFQLKEGTREETEAGMTEAMHDKEVLVVYPEGQINSDNTRKLSNFRHGSFRLAIKHDAALWGWVSSGNEKTWPYGANMGGKPAKIVCSAFEIAPEGAVAYLRKHGLPTEPQPGQTDEELLVEQCKLLAEKVQDRMQEELARLYESHDSPASKDRKDL